MARSRCVELRGLEPLTLCMPCRCATSCATAPRVPVDLPGNSRNLSQPMGARRNRPVSSVVGAIRLYEFSRSRPSGSSSVSTAQPQLTRAPRVSPSGAPQPTDLGEPDPDRGAVRHGHGHPSRRGRLEQFAQRLGHPGTHLGGRLAVVRLEVPAPEALERLGIGLGDLRVGAALHRPEVVLPQPGVGDHLEPARLADVRRGVRRPGQVGAPQQGGAVRGDLLRPRPAPARGRSRRARRRGGPGSGARGSRRSARAGAGPARAGQPPAGRVTSAGSWMVGQSRHSRSSA